MENLGDFRGDPRRRADCAQVEQAVHDGRVKIGDVNGDVLGLLAVLVGGSDHLTHLEATSVDQQGTRSRPMVTPALLVDAGPSAHFPTADQKNLVLQTTGFKS